MKCPSLFNIEFNLHFGCPVDVFNYYVVLKYIPSKFECLFLPGISMIALNLLFEAFDRVVGRYVLSQRLTIWRCYNNLNRNELNGFIQSGFLRG